MLHPRSLSGLPLLLFLMNSKHHTINKYHTNENVSSLTRLLSTLPQVFPENHCLVLEIFVTHPHLIPKSGKDATVWREHFCQVITLMSFCSTLCTPDSSYLAAMAHTCVRQWRSVMCNALSIALFWSPFFIPIKVATPQVATFAVFPSDISFIKETISCWE